MDRWMEGWRVGQTEKVWYKKLVPQVPQWGTKLGTKWGTKGNFIILEGSRIIRKFHNSLVEGR